MTNVVLLNNYQEQLNTSVSVFIEDFISEVGINSKSTRRAYKDDIAHFINFLSSNEAVASHNGLDIKEYIKLLQRKIMTKYRNHLLVDKKLVASSVKRKFSSLKEFAKYLNSLDKGYDINIQVFDVVNKLKTTKNSYEAITLEEATKIIEHIRFNERYEATKKYYYCSLAFDTGIRAEALNKLTPSSFIKREDEVLIKGIDKGNKAYTKSISVQFYEDLYNNLQLYLLDKEENIFNFSEKNRHDMIERAKKALGWSERNITFHSFKKGAVTYAYEITKDIQIAKQVGSHSSINTTQMYIKDSEETFKGAVSNGGLKKEKIDFSEYSKEDIISVLNNLPKSTQLSIKKQLEEV